YLMVQLSTESRWRHEEPAGHSWLHAELELTEEGAALIDAFEGPYREERARLEAELDRRIEALAALLHSVEENGPEVASAVHAIHEVHGQIQALAIAHYFEMLQVLPPDKQERLRDLAVEALSQPQ